MSGIERNKKVFYIWLILSTAMKTETSQKVDFSRELDESYDLSPESIKSYREKGYVKLKNVLSPELLEYYGEVITDWVFKLNKLTKPMEERTTYEKAFLQVMNLWRENEIDKGICIQQAAREDCSSANAGGWRPVISRSSLI